MSVGQNDLGAICHGVKRVGGEMSVGEVSRGEISIREKCHGARCHGASCPWGELSRLQLKEPPVMVAFFVSALLHV
jgi:hypothetical protein